MDLLAEDDEYGFEDGHYDDDEDDDHQYIDVTP